MIIYGANKPGGRQGSRWIRVAKDLHDHGRQITAKVGWLHCNTAPHYGTEILWTRGDIAGWQGSQIVNLLHCFSLTVSVYRADEDNVGLGSFWGVLGPTMWSWLSFAMTAKKGRCRGSWGITRVACAEHTV